MAENSIHCYGVFTDRFLYFRIYHPVVLFAQTFQIRFQCFRHHRLAGYTAALSRFPVSRGTLSAYYTGIPPDTDIPRLQVIQLLNRRANATDSTTRQ